MGFAFAPDERLQLDTFYEAGFDAAVIPAFALSSPAATPSWRYTTLPPPAITLTEPVDGAAGTPPGGFSIFFASLMNIDTLPGQDLNRTRTVD